MTKRKINPFFAIYLIAIFLPIGIVLTILTAILTILFSLFGDYKWCYWPAKTWARLVCYLAFVRVKIKGKEHYSPDKSYVFVANHQSMFDVFLVYGWLNSRFKWVMRKEIRNIPFVGRACEAAGHIFIDRSSAIRTKNSLTKAMNRLKGGASLVIFPEGTRTRDGNIGTFKRGAFRLAHELNLPVVPMTIRGAHEILPYRSFYIKPGRLELIIHEPIDVERITLDNISEISAEAKATIASAL